MKKVPFVLSMALVAILGNLWLAAQVKDFKPVTEAMLRTPPPGDWLNWRRTDNAWGYSPLDQINRQNVTQLQSACSGRLTIPAPIKAPRLANDASRYLQNPEAAIKRLKSGPGFFFCHFLPAPATPA